MTESSSCPKVTVVMPTLNAERFIDEAIRSVICQSFQDWELLVVDGGSVDGTRTVVTDFSSFDARVSFIDCSHERGPLKARAVGIRISRGRYIAFLDSDDIWHPMKLDMQISHMEERLVKFCYTPYCWLDYAGSGVFCSLSVRSRYSYLSYLFSRGMGCSTVVVDRSVFVDDILSIDYFDFAEDALWWLLILKGGTTAHCVSRPLTLYRLSNISRSNSRLGSYLALWSIYRNKLQLGIFASGISYLSSLFHVGIRRVRCHLCTFIAGKVSTSIYLGQVFKL